MSTIYWIGLGIAWAWLISLYVAYARGWSKGYDESKAFESWFQPVRDAVKRFM